SRRRHTRFSRDWSSDVCSSDLTAVTTAELQNFDPGGSVANQLDSLPQFFGTQTGQRGGSPLFDDGGGSYLNMRNLGTARTLILRSEERRVGKSGGRGGVRQGRR